MLREIQNLFAGMKKIEDRHIRLSDVVKSLENLDPKIKVNITGNSRGKKEEWYGVSPSRAIQYIRSEFENREGDNMIDIQVYSGKGCVRYYFDLLRGGLIFNMDSKVMRSNQYSTGTLEYCLNEADGKQNFQL